MPPFNSALLKVQRAQRQTLDLYNEIRAFYTSPDCPAGEIVPERDIDPRKWHGIMHVYKPAREDWPVKVGEIIHNLRSSLDHLVYEASGIDPKTGNPYTRTEFPIYNDEGEFDRNAPRKMRGLNAATEAFITRDQPFKFPLSPGDVHPLWALHELNNADKHRLLNLMFVDVHEADYIPGIFPGKTPLTVGHFPVEMSVPTSVSPLEDGAELFSFTTRDPIPDDAQVNMQSHISFGVFFRDTTLVVPNDSVFKTIEALGKRVGNARAAFMKYNPALCR
jgi:hypothetical protein